VFFRQYQLSCLSVFSYLVGDETTGRAVVVDPQRDVSGYLADAETAGLRIERVIETHFHADFLSGHLELAAATGAAISYGREASPDFPIEPLAHGQRLSLGSVTLEVRHTPGHTPESIAVVVHERPDGPPWGVLTGDTLFVGDVGRPDLLSSAGWTAEELARRLYRSLRDELLTLPDDTRVYPAHGAGSACGKAMSDAVSSTIGEQRRLNYALQPRSEDEFVAVVTEGQSVAPAYFPYAAAANRRDRDLLDEQSPPPRLGVDEVTRLQAGGAVVIDGRAPEGFASGHLRGSVNVGLDGRFAEYAGDVVAPGDPVVLVTDPGRESEARVRLARIGFDRVVGALHDVERVLAERPDLAERGTRLAAADLGDWRADAPGLQVVDVRNPGELEAGVVPGARTIPMPRLLDRLGELDPGLPTVVYCAGGYRSSIAASLLRSKGFTKVADVQGGFEAWRAAGLPVEPASAATR
jgi:hydroxyacylglutathione hydrolase